MKNFKFISLLLIGTCLFAVTSCNKDSETTGTPVLSADGDYYGKSYGEWGLAWWEWTFGFNCANNPITDTDGSLQNQNQSGPVYFLAGTGGTTVVRHVTIPSDKSIFVPLVCIINDFPCPDSTFHPAAGQSLEDFLKAGADGFLASVDSISADLDGAPITDLKSYRGQTGMVNFTGNADLTNCLDVCVTGSPQPAVSDGYWLMLKPLSKGYHMFHFFVSSTWNFHIEVTYCITSV